MEEILEVLHFLETCTLQEEMIFCMSRQQQAKIQLNVLDFMCMRLYISVRLAIQTAIIKEALHTPHKLPHYPAFIPMQSKGTRVFLYLTRATICHH